MAETVNLAIDPNGWETRRADRVGGRFVFRGAGGTIIQNVPAGWNYDPARVRLVLEVRFAAWLEIGQFEIRLTAPDGTRSALLASTKSGGKFNGETVLVAADTDFPLANGSTDRLYSAASIGIAISGPNEASVSDVSARLRVVDKTAVPPGTPAAPGQKPRLSLPIGSTSIELFDPFTPPVAAATDVDGVDISSRVRTRWLTADPLSAPGEYTLGYTVTSRINDETASEQLQVSVRAPRITASYKLPLSNPDFEDGLEPWRANLGEAFGYLPTGSITRLRGSKHGTVAYAQLRPGNNGQPDMRAFAQEAVIQQITGLAAEALHSFVCRLRIVFMGASFTALPEAGPPVAARLSVEANIQSGDDIDGLSIADTVSNDEIATPATGTGQSHRLAGERYMDLGGYGDIGYGIRLSADARFDEVPSTVVAGEFSDVRVFLDVTDRPTQRTRAIAPLSGGRGPVGDPDYEPIDESPLDDPRGEDADDQPLPPAPPAPTQMIRFWRGLQSEMPLIAPAGVPMFAVDTGELWIGTDDGRAYIGGGSGATPPPDGTPGEPPADNAVTTQAGETVTTQDGDTIVRQPEAAAPGGPSTQAGETVTTQAGDTLALQRRTAATTQAGEALVTQNGNSIALQDAA